MKVLHYNLATIEVVGLAPAMVIADHVVKNALLRLVGIEADCGFQSLIKLVGDAANCHRAIEIAEQTVEHMGGRCVTSVCLNFEDSQAVALVDSPQEYSPITEGNLQVLPQEYNGEMKMQAIGILETQGLTGMIEGADAMLKAANVEIMGKEKIGGAYVTVFIRGDVAAVKAALEAGTQAAEKVGKLIAAHVIARPHDELVKLLPR